MSDELKAQDHAIGEWRVARIMGKEGLVSRGTPKKTIAPIRGRYRRIPTTG
ncbi:MAG: hypothetical protein ACFNZW_05460 [Coriobacteriaceae bacterium]